MKVKLLIGVEHPAHWDSKRPRYTAGTVLDAVVAENIPGDGKVWLRTPELEHDPYGILLDADEYEVVEG